MACHSAKRVLIVEDEYLVAMELEALLTEMGYAVIGTAPRIGEAMELARHAEVDFAVLDINLGGPKSFPVADILRERNIPFLFASGYGSAGLIDGYRQEVILRKPYQPQDLNRAIRTVLPLSL